MATGLENLKIYNMAKVLEMRVHEIAEFFPVDERYRSIDQLKRSSASVTNNVAEAYHKRTAKEKIHILRDVAICEAQETESNIARCADKKFLPQHAAQEIIDGYVEFKKATYGYIRFLRNQPTNQLIN